MRNALKLLFQSRKFLILATDATVSCILFFVGKYVPIIAEDIGVLIKVLQPVVAVVILAIAIEDAAEKASGNKTPMR